MASLGANGVGFGMPLAPELQALVFTNTTLDSADDSIAVIVQASAALAITQIGMRIGARTGTTGTLSYVASLQSLTSGLPSGTILGGGSPASVTFNAPNDSSWNGTFQWFTLANAYTCARGDQFAIVIASGSGSIGAAQFLTFTRECVSASNADFPYSASAANGGAYAKSARTPVWGLRTASASYGYPFSAQTATSYSANSTPDEYGMSFSIPSGASSTFQVLGARWLGNRLNAGNGALTLYDTDGTTVLQQVTIASTNCGAINSGVWEIFFDEATLSTLTIGSTYRISWLPDNNAASTTLAYLATNAAQDAAAFPGGSLYYLTTRTNAGAWTDDTTARPQMAVIVSDLTATAGSGYLLVTN